MSSYVNIYAIPKQRIVKYDSNDEEKVFEIGSIPPLHLVSYCRPTGIYGVFQDVFGGPYAESENEYADLTPQKIIQLKVHVAKLVEKMKRQLETDYKILGQKYDPELREIIHEQEEELRSLTQTMGTIETIGELVEECDINSNDFAKIVYNIDY